MPWPVLLFIIMIAIVAVTALLMLLRITVCVKVLLDRQFSIQLHIKLYKINIKTFELKQFNKKKPSRKKSRKKGRIPSLKFIDTQISVYGAVGLMDAKNTALAVGGLYGLLGMVPGAVGHFTSLRKCNLRVDPVYSGNRLYLEADCIAGAKIGNIIIAYIRYLFSKKFLQESDSYGRASD